MNDTETLDDASHSVQGSARSGRGGDPKRPK